MMISTQISELKVNNDIDRQLTQTLNLSNISWQTYQAILADMGEHRAILTSYNSKILTLKMPSKLHEIINRLLARIVKTITEELEIVVVDLGSTRLEREDLAKAVEPDTGFYIQNAFQVLGLNPDIPSDLPPDLVIEVDITSPSIKRIEIYQILRVPEIWLYTKNRG